MAQTTTSGQDLELKHGGVIKGGITVNAVTDRADQSTVSVIFECLYGESVWVESLGDYEIFGSVNPYTVFTGFLLAEY